MQPEPLSTAAGALVAGVTTVFISVLGVHPQGVLWVAVGASVGIVASKPETRMRAVATFLATTLAGALIASAAARVWFDGDPMVRNALALGLGATFPILRERLAFWAPRIFDNLLGRIGGRE